MGTLGKPHAAADQGARRLDRLSRALGTILVGV
jgi:hypothetical protein